MSDWIGQFVGRYVIIEKLGEGGMASVFKAHDTRLDRDVAIKIIRTDALDTGEFLKRFEREAKALAKLQHPNIVNVIDYGDHEGVPYLVMEYISSGTLKDRLGQQATFQEAAVILAPIARALEFAHKKGVIHRDIKPQNILITESGDPMLTDFGIAKFLGGEETTELTKTGLGFGTPGYMAPEQLLGAKSDKRLDIYNIGVVFYEYIAGRKPFRVSDLSEMLLKDDEEMAEHIKRFLPSPLPEEVSAALVKALAKNPDDRFQDMGEFAELIERFSRQEPLLEQAPQSKNPPTGLRKLSNLPNWVKAGLLAGSILSITVVAVAWIGYDVFTRSPQQTDAPVAEISPIPTSLLNNGQESLSLIIPASSETTALAPTITPLPPKEPGNIISSIDGMKLIFIPGGVFTMGNGSGNADESPEHEIFLDNFWIDQTEVTNRQYTACVKAGNCPEALSVGSFARQDYFTNPAYEDYPVIYINYEQAQAYCSWAERRLPTEAEWEKAARGTDGRIFPWGNTAPSPDLLNFNRNVGDTSIVGNYPAGASPYGVLDMSGNVSEWVADWYDSKYYAGSLHLNPPGPVSGIERVLRGGNWEDTDINRIRAIDRISRLPQARSERYIGFRCAVSEE
jgi:eukaryotic-like serine/threonine-protein kinase